jgi:tryptophanyl-tRNA synthetase
MAADILLYGGEVVPVGKDQEQHLEIAREVAGKFNRAWKKDLFKMPQAFIAPGVATVPGTDGAKMSKSKGNVIPLFGTDAEIKKAVMGVVTDSKTPDEEKDPDTNNVYNIHKLFLTEEEDAALRKRYQAGGFSYKDAKEELLAAIIAFVSPMRERYEHYQANPKEIANILDQGGEIARDRAETTMKEVRSLVGLR